MMLNSKGNRVVVWFADNFYDPNVMKNYEVAYQELMLPYDNVMDYVSSTVKSIDLPGYRMDLTETTSMFSKERSHKNSKTIDDLKDRRLTVTFKATEAFFNYHIMEENYQYFVNFESGLRKPNMGSMMVCFITHSGYIVKSELFDQLIPTEISPLKADYTDVENNQSRFTMSFKYNLRYPQYHYGRPVNIIKD